MATSRDVVFRTFRRQLLRNRRIIPVTNIAELLEYVLLSQNDDVNQTSCTEYFLEGLAELGIDKGVIKNNEILSDLKEREKDYRNHENTFERGQCRKFIE